MSEYLSDARRFYDEAIKEFEKGVREKDDVRIRNAAEKAWNSILQATNYLFQRLGRPIPKSHHERRSGLIDLARGYAEVEEKGLRDRYMVREQALHEYCFYEGIYDISLLERDIQKVKQYIEDIEELLKE